MELTPFRILLVDDDEHLLLLGETIIKRLGYDVIAHSNANDALEIFKDLPEQFDLLITDFRMPRMNGAELCKEVLKVNPEIPIIMCSGYSSLFGEEDAIALGIKRFIRKPLLTKEFATLIKEALDNR